MTSIILVATALAALPAEPKRAEPPYQFECKKPKDTITVRKEKSRTVFRVTSKDHGIGGATMSLKRGQWPAQVTLRFEGFSNLEEFRLETDRITVSGSIKTSGHMLFAFVGADGDVPVVEPGAAAPAGELDVRVERRDGAVEVTLPVNLLVGSRKVTFDWVQAFLR